MQELADLYSAGVQLRMLYGSGRGVKSQAQSPDAYEGLCVIEVGVEYCSKCTYGSRIL